MRCAVETAESPTLGTFDGLAKRSGFSVAECALAASSGRLAGIVKVAQRRDAGRKQALAGLPPVPALTADQVRIRMRMLRLRSRYGG
jgi:hypothetical protein